MTRFPGPGPWRSGMAAVLAVAVCAPPRDAAAPAGPLDRCLAGTPVTWELPGPLTELSGLAVAPDGRLLAHADERGRIFEIDPATGAVGRRWVLRGDPRDDFEGIAVRGDSVVLMTSAGRLYAMRLTADTGQVPFVLTETGLGAACELEGLAWDPVSGAYLLPCKAGRTPATRGGLVVFRFAPGRAPAAQPGPLVVAGPALARAVGAAALRLTAVDVDPVTGQVVVVSSRPGLLISVDSGGRVTGSTRLAGRLHPQPEGLALTREALYLGSEGAGRRGTLTQYPCRSSP